MASVISKVKRQAPGVSRRPRVEVLDVRVLLAASVLLPTGQYLNALETLVSSTWARK
jgi:hypothetical protein